MTNVDPFQFVIDTSDADGAKCRTVRTLTLTLGPGALACPNSFQAHILQPYLALYHLVIQFDEMVTCNNNMIYSSIHEVPHTVKRWALTSP